MDVFISSLIQQGGTLGLVSAGFLTVIYLLFRFIAGQTERNEKRNDSLRDGIDKLADALDVISSTLNLVLREVENSQDVRTDLTKIIVAAENLSRSVEAMKSSIDATRREVAAITGRRDSS